MFDVRPGKCLTFILLGRLFVLSVGLMVIVLCPALGCDGDGRGCGVSKVICRGLRKACEVAVAKLDAVSVKPSDDDQVS